MVQGSRRKVDLKEISFGTAWRWMEDRSYLREKRIPLRESRANHAETHVLAAAQRDRERVILRGDIRFLAE